MIGTLLIHYTINMKILVTGGNGKLPKKLKELNGDKYLTPTKEELNLLDKESIKNFFEHNQDIEGIIFSATLYPGQDMIHTEDWFNDDNLKIINDSFNLNYTAIGQLIHLYKDKLKFVIGLTTGMIDHSSQNQCCPLYILGKEVMKNTIERFSYNLQLRHIKMFNLNPGPMNDSDEYHKHSIILDNMTNNIDKINSGAFEWIGDSKFNYEN